MMRYNPSEIEPKWQKIWEERQAYVADDASPKPKFYLSCMFPYPSGAGMHTGHAFEHAVVDAIARFHRAHGENVLNPMGWDAFGLPAENYAIKTGTAPAVVTKENIANFKNQLKRMGASIDWSRELSTSDPDYYRWTQWVFTKFYERGLAYQKESLQWWCPVDKTVLANEQVESGKCWRCGTEVVKKSMKQWFFKITDYADALLDEIEDLDWPQKIKTAQTNWIGKSQGAEVNFELKFDEESFNEYRGPDGEKAHITVFTTRSDTLFGATFLVLAPEHKWVEQALQHGNVLMNNASVDEYVKAALRKSEIERQGAGDKEKTGIELRGVKAINPATGEEIPVWTADYVLGGYGTGAIMAVPAHDERDYEFAEKFKLPIKQVVGTIIEIEYNDKLLKAFDAVSASNLFQKTSINVQGGVGLADVWANDIRPMLDRHNIRWSFSSRQAADGVSEDTASPELGSKVSHKSYEGYLINSGQFDGIATSDAREEIVAWLEQQSIGKSKTTYKMRDWLISRQRYWGAPIPIIHCDEHGAVAVPESQLPVVLPEVEDYAPKGDGKSVLASVEEWVNTTCPTCGRAAKRETDTMDGYACSSWYLLRYTDPHNAEQPWAPEKANAWAPLDYYVGGDHAVAHLLYVRFWTHVFKDMGIVDFKEPVKKLVYHGYVNAEDGTKMSKSKGNVIDPLDIIDQGYGADALRTYLLFMGPIELDAPWDPRGIAGIYRFLNRVWTLSQEFLESEKDFTGNDDAVKRAQHKAIKKATDDQRRLNFNTAISALMEYVNDLYKLKTDGFSDETWRAALGDLVRLLAPFAPHMSAELWQQLGNEASVENAGWPQWDNTLIVENVVTVVVQVNGKLRAKLQVAKDAPEGEVTELALANDHVAKFTGGKKPAKVVYVPGRLVNIVV